MKIELGKGCPVCGDMRAKVGPDTQHFNIFHVDCEFCGKIRMPKFGITIPEDQLRSYLFYQGIDYPSQDWHVFNFTDSMKEAGHPDISIHNISQTDVINWYPKKLSDKIDSILIALSKLSKFYGDKIQFKPIQMASLFFASQVNSGDGWMEQVNFMMEFMGRQNYVRGWPNQTNPSAVVLMPSGLQRVDELQKNTKNSKTAFVAMSFALDAWRIRDAIKEGIKESGYEPRLMDEIEHNHQIVPEMLYEIRNSRFVVVELSHHNNGAYYEAGYALGVGKDVIHVCKKTEEGAPMHFDVKQVNTILWENEDEIAEKLSKRILATIG